jgi:hypothetical protein
MEDQVRRALPDIRQDCLKCREVPMNIGYDRYPHIAPPFSSRLHMLSKGL